jgi:hypothetical protein
LFSAALDIARKFTLPVIFTRRFRKGNLSSSLGSFVVVNREGWMVTADHIVAEILRFSESQQEIQEHARQKALIESDPGLKDNEKRRRIQRLPVSDEWITHQAAMWGKPQWTVKDFFRDSLADIAIGQLAGFDPAQVGEYPVFKNPNTELKSGTSLCRLGFPFQ